MKNTLKLMIIILFSLSLCLLTGCLGGILDKGNKMLDEALEKGNGILDERLKSSNDIVDETAMTILKALENEDAETIKGLFSKEALEQAENIDEEIQAAIDFFEGSIPEGSLHDISVPGRYPAYMEGASTRKGITVIQNVGLYYIETDKARYAMRVTMYSRSDENLDTEGVVIIEILPFARIKWQAYAEDGAAGVFIQDEELMTEEISEEETEEEQDSIYDDDIKISNQVLYDGYKWFGGEQFGYIQIPDDCEEFTEMPNENRPNMIMMRNAAQTVIISVDYFDEVTSDEDAKNMADQIAENAVQMGADSLYDYENVRYKLSKHLTYHERYGTVDEATETTDEYYLYFYVAYIPQLNRGVYVSVEGVYDDVMKAVGMIQMSYIATK